MADKGHQTADFWNDRNERRPVRTLPCDKGGVSLAVVRGKPTDHVILYADGHQMRIPVIDNSDGTWSLARSIES